MTDYFGFYKSNGDLYHNRGCHNYFYSLKKYRIAKILLLILAGILFIIGAGGCFLMSVSNVGSYRY
jgi:hypothetical protein